MGNQVNEWIKKRRKRLLEEWGGECLFCGSTEKLEFAHLKETELNGRGRGRKERLYDVIKHPDSYVLLCNKNHREFDEGKISIQLVRSIS